MTIQDAFIKFAKAITGSSPSGNNIADVMNDAAGDVSDASVTACKNLIKKMNGVEPTGTTITEVVSDGATDADLLVAAFIAFTAIFTGVTSTKDSVKGVITDGTTNAADMVTAYKTFVAALTGVTPDGTDVKTVLTNAATRIPKIILNSSTADSTKKFGITVDDNGDITATEIT